MMNNEKMTKKMKNVTEDETTEMVSGLPVLELPIHILYDIISRLPLETIFSCKCVCRVFLNIIKDPFFAKIHLTKAPSTSAALIVQEDQLPFGNFHPYMLDLDDTPARSSSSSDHHPCHQHFLSWQSHGLTQRNVNCCFFKGNATLISSCNGLLCLYSPASGEPLYCICNPISGECMALPPPISSTSGYTYLNHSGFGFCPKTNKYKVIRFMSFTSSDPFMVSTLRTVALVHTVGTKSWRNIGNAPCPETGGSFDSLLCNSLHWITNSRTTSDLISSFDLETEKFRPVPVPAHFGPEYVSKISWISVGVLGERLCVCYTLGDAQFEVCVMKEYGVRESWIKEFVIDVKFYCGVQVEDLQQPIKFSNNGELLLISRFNFLVSYSPQKGTFREIKKLGDWKAEAIAHVPSLISLKTAVKGKNPKVEKIKLERPIQI